MNRGATQGMDRRTIAPYNRSWCVVGSRHVAENRTRGVRLAFCGKQQREKNPVRTGGNKTKIHELIVGENLSKQWGEPHFRCVHLLPFSPSSRAERVNELCTLILRILARPAQ